MIIEETVPQLHQAKPTSRLHVNSPYTYYGDPTASPATIDLRNQMANVEFEESYHYVNNTFRDITIMKRDGLSLTLQHTASACSKDFTIRRIIKLKSRALSSAIASIASLPEIDSGELLEIKRCLANVDNGKYAEASVMLDYVITVEDLKNKGNTLYHYQSDLVISLKGVLDVEAHPYSPNFLNIGSFGDTNNYAAQKELNLKIRLVDHSATASPKYLSVGGKVFKLYPQKDAPHRSITTHSSGKKMEKTYDNYVQMFYSASNDTAVSNNVGAGCLKMSIQDARSAMGLCDTLHDAANPGRIDAERKKELTDSLHALEVLKGDNQRERSVIEKDDLTRRTLLTQQQHDLELSKMAAAKQKQELDNLQNTVQLDMAAQKQEQIRLEAALQKLDNEKKALDLKRRLQDEAIERERKEFDEKTKRLREEQEARIRNESMYWKEFYEMRSQQRKDTSDFVKFIPGLVIGISGIAAAYLKFSGNAKPA